MRDKKKSNWLLDLLYIVVAVLFIRAYVIQAYKIPTGSMEDTLLIGDFLFATKFNFGLQVPFQNKMVFKWSRPKRGEIIIFKYPLEHKDFVKRCVAIAGDTVEIRNKVLYVNGERVDEPYVVHKDRRMFPPLEVNDLKRYQKLWEDDNFLNAGGYVRDNFGPVEVPEGTVFLMGDNRDNSYDSRYWGPLPYDNLRGRPFMIHWSWEKGIPMYKLMRKIRWDRIGMIVTSI
ncbi:signal peptidase I [candidate division WOR-3 bacterium JGI_Cruoil_03_44_89]|uniref:Signal peptidase I n=1 Tax=candidate division WOR-3 bacterium JGI_Cruoil_03_44_89 TaxID=1973748 RepID=A0A235BZG2_UNCW3|nr:MAG: signal peptidase I [candidate division WOR-3 bacterium JGI_Cruoil_03_44_89]